LDPKFQEELERAQKLLEDSGDEEFVPPPFEGGEEEQTGWWTKYRDRRKQRQQEAAVEGMPPTENVSFAVAPTENDVSPGEGQEPPAEEEYFDYGSYT
jgi:hypothetical protein